METISNKKQDNGDKYNYKKLYQKIKEEIKSVVITKLLNQVEYLTKKYEKLKKENSLIKNDLIYILKRVLLNKNDYIGLINRTNSSLNKSNILKNNIYSPSFLNINNSFLNNKSYNSFLIEGYTNSKKNNSYNCYSNYNYNYNPNNTSINKNHLELKRYFIEDEPKKGKNKSVPHLKHSLQNNIQNKIDYYLNSLYKHNFAEECASGTASVHLLNKEQSIYDELFTYKNRNNSPNCINFDDTNYKKVPHSKERKSSKGKNLSTDENIHGKYIFKKNRESNYKVEKNINNNNILKVQRKSNKNYIFKSKKGNNKKKRIGNKSSSNISLSPKAKHFKYTPAYINNRSPFLVNKY